MTQPNNSTQFLDPNNPLASGGPCRLDLGSISYPELGEVGVVTVRTPSTTVTVLLNPAEMRAWADSLDDAATQLGAPRNGLLVATPQEAMSLDTSMRRSG
jgi:hypothetical protein